MIDDINDAAQSRRDTAENIKAIVIALFVCMALGGLVYTTWHLSHANDTPPAHVITGKQVNHDVTFEYLGNLPEWGFEKGTGDRRPCQLFLMTDTTLDSVRGLTVRRRYVTVCKESTTLTEYDVRIR